VVDENSQFPGVRPYSPIVPFGRAAPERQTHDYKRQPAIAALNLTPQMPWLTLERRAQPGPCLRNDDRQ
jgi:hypothetical protein